MADDRPRLGPWLRSYGREERPGLRERLGQAAAAAGIGVLGLGSALVVLWLFVRRPLLTFGALVAVWGAGFLVLLIKRRRAAALEGRLKEGRAFEELERGERL